ncbi:MAG: hypothetical protein SWO11_07355 [Thermodesulfobacteriota bacterium]|nr:hypothetical protein [Thermodesulfobacteriota bacterium]
MWSDSSWSSVRKNPEASVHPVCRVGTKKMLEILTRICECKGNGGDIEPAP